MSDTFSVRLPKEQTRLLDKMAKETDRSRNKIIASAVARMIENYEYVSRMVEDSDADIAAGRVVSNEEAMRRTQAVIDRAVAARKKV
ncbi:MAG: ribbon-helix-helix protein, CopG family [Proteobacteria bacterium]|nr:ribbon-helix-helix protein, CopG family [Pseudomonadota bacterium]